MELKYKENLGDFVTNEQIEKRNLIMGKLYANKIPTKKECAFLMDFERKTRICYTCGQSVGEAKGWTIATIEKRPELAIGYHFCCLECERRSLFMDFK